MSLCLLSSKVNSRWRRRNVRPAALVGSPLGFLFATVGVLPSISSPTTLVFVDFPVSPTCSLKSRTQRGQGCWTNALPFALVQAQLDTKTNYCALGKIWWMFVFCGCCSFAVGWLSLSLSLISHAWRCLKVELWHHGGGKMWRLF